MLFRHHFSLQQMFHVQLLNLKTGKQHVIPNKPSWLTLKLQQRFYKRTVHLHLWKLWGIQHECVQCLCSVSLWPSHSCYFSVHWAQVKTRKKPEDWQKLASLYKVRALHHGLPVVYFVCVNVLNINYDKKLVKILKWPTLLYIYKVYLILLWLFL